MRSSSLVGWVCIAFQALGSLGCLSREDNRPVLKRIAEKFVGEYQLSPAEHPGGEVNALPGGTGNTKDRCPQMSSPRLILAEDGSFRFTSFPPHWLPDVTWRSETSLEGSGRWRIDSDPEFGVFEHLEVETVNGRPMEATLRLWLGNTLLLDDQNGHKLAAFVRAKPEGER